MSTAPVSPAGWRTFMFAVPGHPEGPLAPGTGTSLGPAVVDAYKRMLQRQVLLAPGVPLQVATRLQQSLERLATQETSERDAFAKWVAGSKVVGADGEPMVVFHGTTDRLEQPDTPTRRSIGSHFGSVAQALEIASAPGGRMLPAFLSISNPVRLTDAGSWAPEAVARQLHQQNLITDELLARVRDAHWSAESAARARETGFDACEALRAALEAKGFDGIVYASQTAGTRPADAWIALRPEQIRQAIAQRPIPAEAFAEAIAQVSRKQQFWKLMLEESRAQTGPFDGGCLIAAHALIHAAGRGELVRVASSVNEAEHYGARIDGVIYDFNGAAASQQDWVERVVSSEHLTDWNRRWHFAEGLVASSEIMADPETSAQVADMLRAQLPMLQPQHAWTFKQDLDLGDTLAVVHQSAGRCRDVKQMGHEYCNDETHLVAISLASDSNLVRRMEAVGYDAAKAKLVLGRAARMVAAQAEMDLALVDWSEVAAEFAPSTYVGDAERPAPAAPRTAPALKVIAAAAGRQIEEDVLQVLRACEVEGNLVRLPPRRLPPKLYGRVDDVLRGLGGRWTKGMVQAHVFEVDPQAVLQVAIATASYVTPQDFGYFPTPQPLVKQVIELAQLEPGMRVLEPEAGRGAIALAAARVVGLENVTCVELLPENASHLRQAGFAALHEQDFLTVEPDATGLYDRILMNPPFSRLADVTHVMHATRFLKPDGRLVAITSPSWEHNTVRKAAAFRDFVEECEGTAIEVPAGAFREAGTGVATRILMLEAERFPWNRTEAVRERQRA